MAGRGCFNCGGFGHQAANCPKAGTPTWWPGRPFIEGLHWGSEGEDLLQMWPRRPFVPSPVLEPLPPRSAIAAESRDTSRARAPKPKTAEASTHSAVEIKSPVTLAGASDISPATAFKAQNVTIVTASGIYQKTARSPNVGLAIRAVRKDTFLVTALV
ncbi:hypothetical protein PHLCEN_2v2420 [Hermanssonia centrifuga]|uniref:CCHC-type domain-containing protein n=1 Tax=Hermanssonia centrifuga TaxID=98765 RepID=A0A2R6RM44_9APHY|nr:hypothetical protein PHLCEN_2v2420 [Hermanssonia centrifuga]